MWSSGSLHNAAISPIDLTLCAAKLTEAVAKGPAVCVSLTPSHQLPTPNLNVLLQQLNESRRGELPEPMGAPLSASSLFAQRIATKSE